MLEKPPEWKLRKHAVILIWNREMYPVMLWVELIRFSFVPEL